MFEVEIELFDHLTVLTNVVYWPSTQPNMPFQRQQKWHIPMASYGKKSCRRAWLTIWDKVKSRSTATNWCTGSKWPVNCMTVISAWWWSEHVIPRTVEVTHSDSQLWGDIEWAIELLYNSVKTGSQLVWRSESLETRCGRESQQKAGSQTSGWAALENRKETLMAIRVGVNMLQFCSVSNFLSHTTLSNKVRGIIFLKDYVVIMILHAYVDVYVLCVCIVGHGGDYTPQITDV